MALSRKQVEFWRSEMKILDTLYAKRSESWQSLIDLYDLRFDKKIRDLDVSEMIRVPLFYPVVRQTVATIAFNYPTLFFTVEDDEGAGADVSDILERAASAFLRLANVRPHLHQAIFDALFCQVGWLRLDYNPPGDDLIPPYVSNDAMHEDLVSVSRVPPGFVHLDPQCPPHQLGHARYIRERMWVPLKQLRDDKTIQHRRDIKATTVSANDQQVMGEPLAERSESPEQAAVRESVQNGEYVLVDRIHDRMNKRQIMFAEGVSSEIQDIDHPFAKMAFEQRMDVLGQPLFEEDGQTPLVNLDAGEAAPGWLVEQGFPFIPIKFDLSAHSFYPTSPMEYLKDLQNGLVESVSRLSANLKRSARQGLLRRSEAEDNPGLADALRKGDDGEWHIVEDPHSAISEISYGSVPPDQYAFEDRIKFYADSVAQVNELTQSGGEQAKTATEAGLLAAAASINREWMEARVAEAYEHVVRGAFQIMGDPRYTPEDFTVNVAPDGQQRLSRALRSADFLWNYRINVQAGSTRPLFEQLQRGKAVDFYDRARQSPNFDDMEMDKFLASAYEVVDPEKLLRDDVNVDAQSAAQLEHHVIFTTMQDPGVQPGQDHVAHNEVHQQYQQDPIYQQMFQQAQQEAEQAQFPSVIQQPQPQMGQQVQYIDALMQQHMQAHQQTAEQEQAGAVSPATSAVRGPLSLQGQIQSNAQQLSDQVREDTIDVQG